MIYHWLRIRARDRGWQTARARLLEAGLPEGLDAWGTFSGLFGIGSNELILVLYGDGDERFEFVETAGFDVFEEHALVPTVRPTAFSPISRPGLYVFRFFDVRNADVDEISELSLEAWTTFEATDAYAAEPQGLFCHADRSTDRGIMLLLTWYDGLESWQTSRRPAPEARANFRRRHAMTMGTIAFATTLLKP